MGLQGGGTIINVRRKWSSSRALLLATGLIILAALIIRLFVWGDDFSASHSSNSFSTTCTGPCAHCAAGVSKHSANEILKLVVPATMLSAERLQANKAAVAYVTQAGLRGDIIEAGVAAGGSSGILALTAARLGSPRRMHLYDTFEGLPSADVSVDGIDAMRHTGKLKHGVDKVSRFLVRAGVPLESLVFHVGDVKNTLNRTLNLSPPPPCEIAVLRLDTDWYESHIVLLNALYPLVVPGGVIISDGECMLRSQSLFLSAIFIDYDCLRSACFRDADYGYWPGAKRAIDEWFAMPGNSAPIITIDKLGIMWCKPGGSKPCDLDNWKSVV